MPDDDILKMRRYGAFSCLNKWIKYIKNIHGGTHTDISLDNGTDMHISYTMKKNDGMICAIIGTGGLSDKNYPWSHVSDMKFTWATVNLFHEARHIEHAYDIGMTAGLSVSDIATRKNRSLYIRNMYQNPMEIDAEYNGIRSAYDVMRHTFPGMDCEKLIVDYVNERISNWDYFIGKEKDAKEFLSMDDICHAFEDAYAASSMHPRTYGKMKGFRRYTDEIVRAMDPDAPDTGWGRFFEAFERAETGTQSDRMAACLSAYIHPEYKNLHACLAHADMSPETIFGDGFPETPEELRIRLGYEAYAGGAESGYGTDRESADDAFSMYAGIKEAKPGPRREERLDESLLPRKEQDGIDHGAGYGMS